MKHGAIISRGEAWVILRNDLRKAALEAHASKLKTASAEERQSVMAQIDREIEKELRSRMMRFQPAFVIY